jgi:hypothetical protein
MEPLKSAPSLDAQILHAEIEIVFSNFEIIVQHCTTVYTAIEERYFISTV